jgi:tetratricopeptide (TPR) repeat protein/predicted Ser/Thr protein kinase
MIGKTISHYRIVEKLGEGGMGFVYRAEDVKLGREVALKFLPPEWTRDTEARARFLHEAQAAASLSHPNICTVYEIDEAEGHTFIAMEVVEGESLKNRIARGPMKIHEAVIAALEIAQGLAAAHARGIVHRDIKPENVMVTAEGRPKLMDFGLAMSRSRIRLTRTGTTTGTVAYMSPEQSRGEEVDRRTDIWSFGAMLYEMLTGRLPFRGDHDQAVIHAILNDEPEPITALRTGVPIELDRIVAKAMAKRTDERYQHIDDLIADLRTLRRELDSGTVTASVAADARTRRTAVAPAGRRAGVSATWRWATIPAIVVIALVMAWRATHQSQPAPDLVANRVLVAACETRTGDPSLDPVGQLAGDSITDGLTEIGTVEVAPTVAQPARAPGGEAPDGLSLAREAGAALMVSGAYYLEGDSLRFQASVSRTEDATVIQTVRPIRGPRASPSVAIERLRQRIIGAVAFRLDSGLIHGEVVAPPTYPAYQEYSIGMRLFGTDYPGAVEHFERAAAIDTTFMAPRIYIYFSYWNRWMYAEADSVLQTIERRRTRLAPYEQRLTDYMAATMRGDDAEALRALRLLEGQAPDDGLVKYLIGYTALGLNRPRESVSAFEATEFRQEDAGFYVRSWGFSQRADALHLLEEYDEELEVVRQGLEAYPDIIWLRGYEARALIALGRLNEARALIDETLSQAGRFGTPVGVMRHAAGELRVHVGPEASIAVLERAIALETEELEGESVADDPDGYFLLANLLYEAERWPEARDIVRELAAERPDDLDVTGFLGTTAARLGHEEEARATLEELRSTDRPYLYGKNALWAADIASLLGDKELAVRLLRQAFAEGLADPMALHQDMDLESLHGYPPFEELRRPKG